MDKTFFLTTKGGMPRTVMKTETKEQPNTIDRNAELDRHSSRLTCSRCGNRMTDRYVNKCVEKFKKPPKLCPKCFMDSVVEWAMSDDEEEE